MNHLNRALTLLLCLLMLLPAAAIAQENAAAVAEHQAMLAMIPPSSAPGDADVPKGAGVDYAILGTPVAITLPAGSYLYSTNDSGESWISPSTGHLIRFGRSSPKCRCWRPFWAHCLSVSALASVCVPAVHRAVMMRWR